MTKRSTPDFDETRAGFRTGEGSDSVMYHLMAAARRREKRREEAPVSLDPAADAGAGDTNTNTDTDTDTGGVDIPLPP